LLVALTSYVLYKQALSRLDTSVLLVTFIGVIWLVTGGAKKENLDEEKLVNLVVMILPTILLVLLPVNECSI
jgi:drug/metabolite transporter (DMT)-like permease